jgi:hypothetical protein
MRHGLLRRQYDTTYTSTKTVKDVLKEELPDGYSQNLKGMRLFTR